MEIKGELVEWKERWTNTGKPSRACLSATGVPAKRPDPVFRGGDYGFRRNGRKPENPTLFVESRKSVGNGFGVMAESDWLRLLFGMQTGGDVAQLYSQTLALARDRASTSP